MFVDFTKDKRLRRSGGIGGLRVVVPKGEVEAKLFQYRTTSRLSFLARDHSDPKEAHPATMHWKGT